MQTKSMTSGKPLTLIFFFSLPLMFGNIFQQLYVVVDTMIVGKFSGVQALASLGAADWINWMVLGIITGFTQGFSIKIAQKFGANDQEGLKKSLVLTYILAIIFAIILVVITQVAITPTLTLLKTPADIKPGAITYLRVMFAGIPLMMLYNTMASILRAFGDSKTPLMAMIIAAIINVILDLFFVIVLQWGIFGAAFATIIAQGFAGAFCWYMVRKIEVARIKKEEFKFDLYEALHLLVLGTPMAFQNMVIAVGGMIVQSVVNSYGYLVIAGFTATNKLYGVLEVAATSYGYAVLTYVAQNLGARKVERIRKGVHNSLFIALVTSVIITLSMLLFGESLLRLFISGTPSEISQALSVSTRYLYTLSIPLAILYTLHIYRSSLQGMGDTVLPMLSGIAELIMRVSTILILPTLIGPTGLYYAEVTAWSGAVGILLLAYYYRLGKLDRKIKNEILGEELHSSIK